MLTNKGDTQVSPLFVLSAKKLFLILPQKNITNLTFELITHNINALAGDVWGDVLGDVR
jgi:hypothetical protein